MGGDWWQPHCNVYCLSHRLVSARRRRAALSPQLISGTYESKKIGGAVNKKKDNKISLSNAQFYTTEQDSKHILENEKKAEQKQKCSPGEAKKPGQGKAKTITAQQ